MLSLPLFFASHSARLRQGAGQACVGGSCLVQPAEAVPGHMSLDQITWSTCASHRVPAEFMVQNPDAANPPTLFLVLADMAREVAAAAASGNWTQDSREDAEFLQAGGGLMLTTQEARNAGFLMRMPGQLFLSLGRQPCWIVSLDSHLSGSK